MRRKIGILILGMMIFMSGCGENVINKEIDNGSAGQEETQEIEVNVTYEEAEVAEAFTEEVVLSEEEELEKKYNELVEKYYVMKPTKRIPRLEELYEFQFEDTLYELEDVAGKYDRVYVYMRFENEARDIIMIDRTRESAGNQDDISEKFDEIHQASWGNIRSFSETPNVGDLDVYYKSSTIKNVVDTGINYGGYRYYVIDNGYGLEGVLPVNEEYCWEDVELYQFGYEENGVYYNKEYGIKESGNLIKFSFWSFGPRSMSGYSEALNSNMMCCIETSEGDYSSVPQLLLRTYEFPMILSEEDGEKLIQEQYPGIQMTGVREIGGETYQAGIGLHVDYQDREIFKKDSQVYYRIKDNKVLVISLSGWANGINWHTYDDVLNTIEECAE